MVKRKSTKGGLIILTARKARGYSRESLANQMGYSVNTLYNWEKGRCKVSFDDVDNIVSYLHLSLVEVEELIDRAA